MARVRGLDSIRVLCAFWVVMGHFGSPPIMEGVARTSLIGWLVNGLYNNMSSGPSAVTVFFIISGFCIHYPYAKAHRISSLTEYFSRRYVRIGVPVLAAILLSRALNLPFNIFYETIL